MSVTARDLIVRIPASVKASLRVLYLAKHADSQGTLDATDGNHALYHHEMRSTLEAIGLNVATATSYDALANLNDFDFVLPLLNRGGFQNSEMLGPLLLARAGIPYLGASPILRGLSDDKHLTKVVARQRGVPTAPWSVFRRGGEFSQRPPFAARRFVVKPNASSASWGLSVVDCWDEVTAAVRTLHAEGYDAIVEPWTPLLDVAVPVVGGRGEAPWLLPAMVYRPADPERPRTYEEKRSLGGTIIDDPLEPFEDACAKEQVCDYTRELVREFWPFDYGRFEYRFDPATGALSFMEVNLSCNLWSKKSISRAAARVGIDHLSLVEAIVAHSLQRQGLLHNPAERLVA
jgi:D-alanine-D-alanine ligase